MKSVIIPLLCTLLINFSNSASPGLKSFQSGKYYTVTNVASGKVMSVDGKNFTRGADVVVKLWEEEPSQKWLALEAPIKRSHSGRDLQTTSTAAASTATTSKYILIPMRQKWDWKETTQNGSVNITIKTLPQNTEVLTLDSLTGNLTTASYIPGSSSQQWGTEETSTKSAEPGVLLKNVGNNQCIKNYDYKPSNLLHKLVSFIRRLRKPNKKPIDPNPLSTLDCSAKDISQKWVIEGV